MNLLVPAITSKDHSYNVVRSTGNGLVEKKLEHDVTCPHKLVDTTYQSQMSYEIKQKKIYFSTLILIDPLVIAKNSKPDKKVSFRNSVLSNKKSNPGFETGL